MLKNIHIENFKCFKEHTSFPLSRINLLTGINGRGKSTLLQTLLLFKQSIELNRQTTIIHLKGESIELGSFDDIKNSATPKEKNIKIGFSFSDILLNEVNFEFSENIDEEVLEEFNYKDEFVINLDKINYKTSEDNHGALFWHDNIFNEEGINFNADLYEFYRPLERIHYISADRIGPLKYHDKESLNEDFVTVGSKGEFCINILNKLGGKSVSPKLCIGNDAQILIQQTEEWLNYIFEGAKISIKGKEREDSVLNVLFNTSKTKERYKPINVGFGYSYILPIIVAGLIAEKGEILIVENPEAHLHPKAQSRITEFLTKVASTGVQVFIESHSEHVLNGIVIATLREDIEISSDEASLLYFQTDKEPAYIKLNLMENGEIDNWVEGFFDQQEIDLATIFKLSRKK